MVDEEPELEDLEVFDTSAAKVGYSRTRDTHRVTLTIHDPAGISELKLYLILCMECEKLEQRLGITPPVDHSH